MAEVMIWKWALNHLGPEPSLNRHDIFSVVAQVSNDGHGAMLIVEGSRIEELGLVAVKWFNQQEIFVMESVPVLLLNRKPFLLGF